MKSSASPQKSVQPRFAPLAREQMNEAQQRVLEAIAGGPRGGLAQSIVDDILHERRPAKMEPDEEVVYELCTTLHKTHFVDDALFARAVRALGERGVVDLVSVSGYYTLVSMVLNVAEIPMPDGTPSPW